MLEKNPTFTPTFTPPHNPKKNSENCFKIQKAKIPKRDLGIALPERNSEDNSDSSLLIRLLRRVGN